MKIAKISNKPISVLLSVLVVLLSFAATGAFSISASALNNDNSQYAVTGEAVMDGYWKDQPTVSAKGGVMTFNSQKDRFEVTFSQIRNKDSDIKFVKDWAYITSNDSYTCSNDNVQRALNNNLKLINAPSSFSSITIWIQPIDKKYGFEYDGSGSGGGGGTETKTYGVIGDSAELGSWDTTKAPNLTYNTALGRYEKTFTTFKKGTKYLYKFISNNAWDDALSGHFNFTDNNNLSFQHDDDFTSCTIWLKISDKEKYEEGVDYGVDFVNAPTPTVTYTLTFDGADKGEMSKTSTGYTCTVENVEKGNSIPYIIKKNGTEQTSTGNINVPQWDSEVTITCDSDGTKPNAEVTKTPSYVIFDGANGLTKNSNMNSNDAKYKFNFENDEYSELGPFTAEKNDINYTYNIAKNGTTHENYTLSTEQHIHDNSTVMVSLNVTSNSDFSGTSKVKDPEYKYNNTPFTLVEATNGAGTDGNRYQTTIENWQTSTSKTLTISVNGTNKTATIPAETEVNEGSNVIVFWDETKHDFDFEVKNPDEHNYGDLNGDSSYNVIDAYIIRKIADTNGDKGKLQEIGATDVLIELANVDGSNEQDFKVTQADVDLMNDYIVGNITDGSQKNIGKKYEGSAQP